MPDPIVLFAGKASQREAYARHLAEAMAEEGVTLDLRMAPEEADPAEVDYLIFAANGPLRDLRQFPRLRAILNLWAGVEQVLARDLPDVPLVRMIEPGLTLGMVDYVTGHALRHHLDIDRYIGARPPLTWFEDGPPLSAERTVGILGLGELGAACGRALAGLGFRVLGWSRRAKAVEGVATHAGDAGLDVVLARSEILVLLLPQTPATLRILDAAAIARMPRGACVINAGRGPLIDHAALLAALDRGHLRHATLDVFDREPLPESDPCWSHPGVTVTPHIASVTRPPTAARAIVSNIARDLAGEPLRGIVDRARGY